MVDLSVVIPLFSDHRTYVDRLPLQRKQWISLKNQTDHSFELILADNASHDDVVGLAREYFPDAVSFRNEIPKNTTGSRVMAVQMASCPHVVTLDSDCIVYPRFIENWKWFVEDGDRAEVGVGNVYWYDQVVLSGREFIVGDPGSREQIDYIALEKFLRKTFPGTRPRYSIPLWIFEEGISECRLEPYKWASGFYYTNACFPKEIYLEAGVPDADLIGYGHDDSLFGIRLKAMKTSVKSVYGVPAIHQCHRVPGREDLSNMEDCKTATEHEERVRRLYKELSDGPKEPQAPSAIS